MTSSDCRTLRDHQLLRVGIQLNDVTSTSNDVTRTSRIMRRSRLRWPRVRG